MTTPKPVAVSDQTKPMLTLDGLCQHCAAQTGLVMTLLKEGVAQWAQGKATATWRFSRVPVRRVTTAWRLQRDLGMKPASAALVLQRLDKMETLRAQLTHLDPAAAQIQRSDALPAPSIAPTACCKSAAQVRRSRLLAICGSPNCTQACNPLARRLRQTDCSKVVSPRNSGASLTPPPAPSRY